MKVVSMRGQVVDMGLLMQQNETKIALGNAQMNTRGDRVGQGGVVTQTHEELSLAYNSKNPKAVKQVGLNDMNREVLSPSEAVSQQRKAVQQLNKQATPEQSVPRVQQDKTSRRKIVERDS